MTDERRIQQRWPLIVLTLGTLAVLAAVLLSPEPANRPLVTLVDTLVPPLPGMRHSPLMPATEFLANIALFVPVGYLLVRATDRWWAGMAGGVLLSACFEAAQGLLPERVSSVNDVLASTLGTLAGSVIAAVTIFLRDVRDEQRDGADRGGAPWEFGPAH